MATASRNWGIPPIEKVHEAFSAVIDERVKLFNDYAIVSSSDYKKEYTVQWRNNDYSSNDNASYWQGYIGYPVIAVLMIQNKISYDTEIASYFKGINWKELNIKHKNNFPKAVLLILEEMNNKGIDVAAVNYEVDQVYSQIKSLDIKYKKSKLQPPK